jgi:hypothetical protein
MPQKGTNKDIAIQGFSTPEGLGVSTQGFIEPILGDVITGGEGVVNRCWTREADGGLILGGAGLLKRTWCYIGSGGMVFSGDGAEVISKPFISIGGVVLGGAAIVELVTTTIYDYIGDGGVVTGGMADYSRTWCPTVSGGVIIGGDGNPIFVLGVQVSRGGVFAGRRRGQRVEQGINFEYAEPHYEESPWDYWKKIEKAIEDAKLREKRLFKHKARGGMEINATGKARIVILHRDLADSEVHVKSNFTIDDKIKIEIEKLFKNDMTQDEIIALDDMFIMNDLFNRGDYQIKTGNKSRFRHRAKTASGEATVAFKPASAKVQHRDFVGELAKAEDESIIFGEYSTLPSESQEEEELRLLGLID